MLSTEATFWLKANGLNELTSRTPLGSEPTSQVCRYSFAEGRSVVWKEQPGMSYDFFQAEADGLAAIRATQSLAVPKVFFLGEDGILLEDLRPAPPSPSFWEDLGRALAALHSTPGPYFGFPSDNYCGLTVQRNTPTADGFEFFARHRLEVQADQALARGLLPHHTYEQILKLADALKDRVPEAPAVLVHGAFWMGNVMSNDEGDPAVIDPSAYWGWAVTDLARTLLFGEFSEVFYAAYEEAAGIDGHWRDSALIFNLYHQLNHLNQFGDAYLRGLDDALKKVK